MGTFGKVTMIAFGVLLGLASTTAGAGVIYRWHTISTTQYLNPLSGQLEITNAAWLAGSLDYSYHGGQSAPSGELAPYAGDPVSPIVSSQFSMASASVASADPGPFDVVIYPVTGVNGTVGFPWFIDASLSFDHHSGLLNGSLYVNNQESDYEMSSNELGSLWTITRFNTDREMDGCHDAPGCSGATGFWVIDPSTVPVPEPAGLALVGFAFLFLLGVRLYRTA